MADDRKSIPDRAQTGHPRRRTGQVTARKQTDARPDTPQQTPPAAEADDTLEGEGSPGLTIMGGGGHA